MSTIIPVLYQCVLGIFIFWGPQNKFTVMFAYLCNYWLVHKYRKCIILLNTNYINLRQCPQNLWQMLDRQLSAHIFGFKVDKRLHTSESMSLHFCPLMLTTHNRPKPKSNRIKHYYISLNKTRHHTSKCECRLIFICI